MPFLILLFFIFYVLLCFFFCFSLILIIDFLFKKLKEKIETFL